MAIKKKSRIASLAIAVTGFACSFSTAHASGFAVVTNGDDTAEGSLRYALEIQEASFVYISPKVSSIRLLSSLTYDSEKALTILGTGQNIRAEGNFTALALTEGADLSLYNIQLEGPGNFSILNRGDIGQDAGKGVFIDVREDQTETVKALFKNVSVKGFANHGIHISDCSLADDCGGGGGGGGDGSPASISLILKDVLIEDVGYGKQDGDGFRVDERGPGSIYLTANRLISILNGADGGELDEGNDGSVFATINRATLSNNGGYCDPAILNDNLPDPDEGEFDESEQVSEADIPGTVTGSEDDRCFEREVDLYDSGFVEEYAIGLDPDDGIDFDEAGEGSIVASFVNSTISENDDEGVDMDEAGNGGVWVSYVSADADMNADDAFKVSELDEGSVVGYVFKSSAKGNGGKGFVFEEENGGDLFVSVKKTSTAMNDDSDDTGIEVVQEDEGSGKLRVRKSDIADGIDTDGVDEI